MSIEETLESHITACSYQGWRRLIDQAVAKRGGIPVLQLKPFFLFSGVGMAHTWERIGTAVITDVRPSGTTEGEPPTCQATILPESEWIGRLPPEWEKEAAPEVE